MGKLANRSNNGQKSIGKTIIIGIILVALLAGFYYYMSAKTEGEKEKEGNKVTKTGQMLQYDFDRKYPLSPKEVVKYYSEITQCFYNEEISEEDVYALAMQIQKLYDEELIGNQTEEEYIEKLKSEIASMKENEFVISSYSISSSTNVEYYTDGGYEWASLYCVYGIRKGTAVMNTNEKFLLRKDEAGRWKIYGWTLADN
ncbi:DUF6715 family protein [Kineothrix sedimenti]|uniref:DUF6715 family protein n=1 Tax=Kineothrix sedimenti TaxID=3123317 RepID=A0ABZ3F113_9FIRM